MKRMSHSSRMLLLFATFAFAYGGCTDGLDCPQSLPYCTPLGCVLSCPDNAFINQTTCVHDCGNEFILNKECVPECPDSHPYIRRKIVLNQFRFHALKFCQDKCPANTLIHETQCVDACPGNASYVLESKCSTQCPITHRYHRNILKNGIVVAIECLSDCNGKFSFKYGNECLEACKPPLYNFERECLDACPPNARFLYQVFSWHNSIEIQCKDSCPTGTYQLNKTCVYNCPKNNFIYNDSMCVDKCPSDMPYVLYQSQIFVDYEELIFCKANCNTYYLFNGSCVKNCPETMVVVNNTCEESCPSESPFTCDETKENLCRNPKTTMHFWVEDQTKFKRKCINKCPEKLFVDGTICTSKCSESKKFFNNSCYDSCPKDFPYITSKAECVSKCPEYSYFDSGICVERCTNKKFLLEEDRICVNSCSPSKHVIRGNTCLQRCPNGMYNNSGKCVENCPSSLSYNNTCIDKCPEDRLLLIKPFGYSSTWTCTSECPDSWFFDNGTCVQDCHPKKISPNNTCVPECPDSYQLLKNTGRHYEKKWHCVDRCPDDQFINNGTCVEKCPKNKHFQNVCVNKCPASHPLMTNSYSVYNSIACVDRCAADECLLNETCTKLYKFSHGVVFQGKCLQECPPGYNWFYFSTYINEKACDNNVTLLSIFMAVCVVMSFLWSFCCWKFCSTKDATCIVLKFLFCEGYYRKPQLDDEVLFLGTDFNKEDNGGFVNDELPTDITRTRGDGCEEMLLLGQTGVEHQETEDDAVKGTEADILIRNNASELEDDGRVCERDMLGISETNSLTGQPEILRIANGSTTDDNKVEVKVTVKSLELKKYGAGK